MLAVNQSCTTLVPKLEPTPMPAFPAHQPPYRPYLTTEGQPVLSTVSVINGGGAPFPASVFEDDDELDGMPGEASDDEVYADGDAGVVANGHPAAAADYWTPLPVHGVLSKWTNLFHGWQERYFVLADGLLTYYRNADEVSLGSRGSIRIRLAEVKTHEYDECRFEVRVGESIWYLRGISAAQRQSWMSAIERHRLAESGYASERTLNRPTSMASLASSSAAHSPSLASASSFKRGHRLLEKLAEMTTFKELLCKQVDTLQAYFDTCSSAVQPPKRSASDRVAKRSGAAGRHLVDDDPEVDDYIDDADDVYVTGDRAASLQTKSSSRLEAPDRTDSTPSNGHLSRTENLDSAARMSPSTTTTTSGGGGFFSRFLPFRSSHTAPVANSPVAGRKSASPTENGDASSTENSTSKASSPTTAQLHHLWRVITQHAAMAMDFRGEGHMFKATTAGILTNLSHAVELMQCREDQWRRQMKREVERYRRLEEQHRALAQELLQLRQLVGLHSTTILPSPPANGTAASPQGVCAAPDPEPLSKGEQQFPRQVSTRSHAYDIAGPDYQEGPNSPIREEQFYDAIDAELDKIEQDQVRLEALKSVGKLLRSARAMPASHPLHEELEKCVSYRLRNFATSDAFLPPGDRRPPRTADDHGPPEPTADSPGQSEDWQVITQDGDLIIYQREMETDDGVVLDPLQAVHRVPFVTARELCTYFWDVQYRMDWEFTIDQAPTVLEVCGDDTVVLHQLYKRVWPTTQRDAVYWSHIRQVSTRFPPSCLATRTHQRSFSMGCQYPSLRQSSSTCSGYLDGVVGNGAPAPRYPPLNAADSDGVLDSWMVVNMSTDYRSEGVPISASPIIRLGLDVVLYCQTVLSPPSFPGGSLSRSQLSTRLVYMANINPGGWVPAAGLRTLARREYPRFLKRFSAYVQQETKDKTPLF